VSPGTWTLGQPWTWCCVNVLTLRQWNLLFSERAGPPTTTPFSTPALCCLNISACPSQTLLLSTTAYHDHFPSQTLWPGVPRLSESWLFLVFKSRVAQSGAVGSLSRWQLAIALWEKKCLSNASWSWQGSHCPHTWFKAYRRCGLVLQLGLPVSRQGHLPYFIMESSTAPPHQGAGAGAVNCFLIYSVAFLFLCAFQMTFFYSSQCSFSFSLTNTVSLLLPWLFLFIESAGESFYPTILLHLWKLFWTDLSHHCPLFQFQRGPLVNYFSLIQTLFQACLFSKYIGINHCSPKNYLKRGMWASG
jgi:hypothetical protein